MIELINLFINKPNRNDDSYRANTSVAEFNMDQLEYAILPESDLSFATSNTKQSSHIDLVNTPRNLVNNISETPNIPQDINSKESVRRIVESEKFTNTIFEKMKIENFLFCFRKGLTY